MIKTPAFFLYFRGLVGCLLMWAVLMSAGNAAAQPVVEPIILKSASGTAISAELGLIAVPENRSRPAGTQIQLRYIRIKSRGTDHQVAHVFLAGGPGASGIDLIKDFVRSGGEEFFNWIDGDVIGIDQRGTGLSVPNLKTDALYDLPLTEPADRAEYLKRMNAACLQVADQFRAKGIDLSAYNSVESADDIDAIRAALGYKKVILWGRSYGSHLALATLKRHESHIEKVVLCSPEGPDHTFKLPSAADETIGRLGELVRADPQMGKSIPDLRLLIKQVLDGLERQPIRVQTIHPITQQPITVGISKFDIQLLTAQAVGIEQQMRSLPRAYLKMLGGDFDEMAKVLILMRGRWGVESAMKQVMDCSSGASPQRLTRIREEASHSLLGDTINFPYPEIANAWGNPDLGPAYREPIQSSVPVLLICGDLDARTPVTNARELMIGLPAAQLIVAENGGHDLNMFGTPALRSLIAEFLHDQKISSEHIKLPGLKFLPIN